MFDRSIQDYVMIDDDDWEVDIMNCEKCETALDPAETYEHGGRTLCEDCYIELKSVVKTCDPWAVHTAKGFKGGQPILTPVQERIMDLLRREGPITAEEACGKLKITESEFHNHFASLRHMELARGFNKDGESRYTLFGE